MTFPRLLKTAAAAALMLASGCTSDYSPAYVTGFFPLQTGEDATCLADFQGESLIAGLLDTTAPSAYLIGVRLENVLKENTAGPSRMGDSKELSQDSNTLVFDRLQLDFRVSEGAPFTAPPSRTVALAAVVKPTETANISMPLFTQAIFESGGLTGKTGGDLITKVTFLGRSLDGVEVQSQPIEFPVTLCAGCLAAACPENTDKVGCNPAQADGFSCKARETETPVP